MNETAYSKELYGEKLEKLFVRYPSVQSHGFGGAYKPGLEHMLEFAARMGHPERRFKSIHVAGTNGKGSVANMLAAALSAAGLRVGLYTSPHIIDFRERMRIIDGSLTGCALKPEESGEGCGVTAAEGSGGSPSCGRRTMAAGLISRESVWEFITTREELFEELSLSFFEITTGMAFWWFAEQKVDMAVIEVGLGGRLDSTNIVTPELSIITSIGLDHCALLGNTRAEIAAEKAGIIKPGVPVVVGTRDEETAPVFEGAAAKAGAALTFADSGAMHTAGEGCCQIRSEADAAEAAGKMDLSRVLAEMDLQGAYQEQNLRTALTALKVLGGTRLLRGEMISAIARTAQLMGFHGRWEFIGRDPDTICDIGHNPPALKQNFAQLEEYLSSGRYSRLIIVYGVMSDKDLSGVLPLMPEDATYICVAPATPRALKEDALYARCRSYWESSGRDTSRIMMAPSVAAGVKMAREIALADASPAEEPTADKRTIGGWTADGEKAVRGSETGERDEVAEMIEKQNNTLIYIGGSTFVVSEAVSNLNIL